MRLMEKGEVGGKYWAQVCKPLRGNLKVEQCSLFWENLHPAASTCEVKIAFIIAQKEIM